MNFSDYCGFWLVSRLFRLISRRFFHSFYISTISSILLLIVLQFPLYSLIVPAFFVQNFIHRNGTKTLIHFSINVVIRKWPGSHRIHTQPVTHTHTIINIATYIITWNEKCFPPMGTTYWIRHLTQCYWREINTVVDVDVVVVVVVIVVYSYVPCHWPLPKNVEKIAYSCFLMYFCVWVCVRASEWVSE